MIPRRRISSFRPLVLTVSLVSIGGCASGRSGPEDQESFDRRSDSDESPTLVADLLRDNGPDREALILEAVDRSDADRRERAVRKIAAEKWGAGPAILPLYRMLLSDPDPTVRAAAVSALARHGDETDVPEVAAQLNRPDAFLRWEAAKALRTLPGDAAVVPLIDAIRGDEDSGTRVAAAEALGRYPRREVFEALRFALLDTDYAVVAAAAHSLATLTGEDLGTSPEAWQDLSDEKDENLFAGARSYEPRPYREPPGLVGRLFGAD